MGRKCGAGSNPQFCANVIEGLVVTFVNINKLKKAEQKSNRQGSKSAPRTAPSPAVLYSRELAPTFRTTHMSQEVAEITGYPARKFLRTPDFWRRRIHHEDQPRVIQAMEDTSKAAAKVVEYRFQNQDGEYVWLIDHFRIVRDAKGKPIEVVGTLSAKTPLKPRG